MYTIAADWTGEQSLFFRILLSDEAVEPSTLREVTKRISKTIEKEIKAEEFGLQTYFNFRTESEQAMLREPTWEV